MEYRRKLWRFDVPPKGGLSTEHGQSFSVTRYEMPDGEAA